jgi:hypothetical protein
MSGVNGGDRADDALRASASERAQDEDPSVGAAFVDGLDGAQTDRLLDQLADDADVTITVVPPTPGPDSTDNTRRLIRLLAAVGATGRPVLRRDGMVGELAFTVRPEQLALIPPSLLAPWAGFGQCAFGSPDPAAAQSRWSRFVTSTATAWAVFIAILGALAFAEPILSGLYAWRPELRPDAPPTILGASLSNVALEERRTTVLPPGYCVTSQVPSGTAQPEYNIVSFDVEFIGFKGDITRTEWVEFDADTGERVGQPGNRPGPNIRPEAPNDRATGQICVGVLVVPRCVFVRVYLYEEDGTTRLDYADTEPFDTKYANGRTCKSDPVASPVARAGPGDAGVDPSPMTAATSRPAA